MQRFIAGSILLTLLAAPADAEGRWASAFERFREADAAGPDTTGALVFVGSSSIRLWDLDRSFGAEGAQPLAAPLVNRGFGGSQIADSVGQIDLLVLRHKPRGVVLYAGDNDVASGKGPQRVAEDFDRFVAAIHRVRPGTPVWFLAIKPSLARWGLAGVMRDANGRVQARCDEDPALGYIDVWTPMIGADGKPRPELFADDGLHLNEAGYELWSGLVAEAVGE